ncbi:hypothetical protein Kisp01_59570 [Kineosporia sp. NBRC 101677]|uniref:hypothetical protein n=1 Tax=Kineosporia sp. NBRC 101677 TaxID=3032197 RepID=UPI0024A19C89|nr:hypothetical protein [Kineosporia sp. NBRC 101677]GLY18943.1 hypothetical protein Kisp01_59570 [Kineosporia sp. NBRC 101677]
MNAKDGGSAGDEQPDLDLDQPRAGDAQVVALFRNGLEAGTGPAPDLRGIERRAKKKHRTSQAIASGAVTAAAALTAVAVAVSPWSTGGGGDGVPAGPTPTPSTTQTLDTTIPDVTRSSLLQTGDISDKNWSIVGPERLRADGEPQDLSGEPWIGGVCVDDTFGAVAPDNAWEQTWFSDEGNTPANYAITEKVAQWPGQPDQAAAVLDGLRAQLKECTSGPGQEGLSVTTDRTSPREIVVPYLAATFEDGQNIPQAQVFAVWGDALISVEVAVPSSTGGPQNYEGNEDEAYTGAMSVLDSAVYRLTGRVPGDGAPSGLEPAVPDGVVQEEGDLPTSSVEPSATSQPGETVPGSESGTGDGQ